MRCDGRGAQPEAAVGVADGVGEAGAAGHDEQRMALAELAEHGAQRPQRVASPSPPPTLTTVSTARRQQRGERRRRARRWREVGHRSSEARRDLAAEEGAGADRDDGCLGGQLHAARRVLDLAQLLGVEERRDRVDLAGVELLDVGADQPGDALARERDGGRAAVGRRAVVGLRRQMAEHEMDVGADREGLGRHRAPLATDRHARRDRREVGAQHAGVDELARQQPLEVVAAGRGDAPAGDRDDVGGRAADVDQQRVGMRVGDRERRRHPVGGGDVPWPRARRRHGYELAGHGQHAQLAERGLRRVEHERHALALGPERVGQLGGHRDRHGVGRAGLGGDLAQHRGRAPRGRARSRTGARPSAAIRPAARRPWCSRRRCPLLASPACAWWESSISRTAWRFTPCAASANAIARSTA